VQGFKVNEGAALLEHDGNLFLTYSASATDERYCVGLLSAPAEADLMDPANWAKSPEPVMRSAPERCIFGPGHNSFTTDECGRDVMVFHARDYREIVGDPLYDPNRHARVQYVRYDAAGWPLFDPPAGNGPLHAP
jgi:GH43 family beta-xylosidase